jgi:hypothetical protein
MTQWTTIERGHAVAGEVDDDRRADVTPTPATVVAANHPVWALVVILGEIATRWSRSVNGERIQTLNVAGAKGTPHPVPSRTNQELRR